MRTWRLDFKNNKEDSKEEVFYDLLDDYPLIEASFLEQYGIRLNDVEMSWREFADLTSCLSAETPLGRIVAIRSETDSEVLKKFTPSQNKIRREWKETHRKELSEEEYKASMSMALAMALA